MVSERSFSSSLLSHRLRGFGGPEGSLTALGAALERDIAWVEIDTRQTADGQVIVFHDTRLGRITTASGRVRAYSVSERGLPRYSGESDERVPTLDAFLEEFASSRRSTQLMLDIKDLGSEESHVELLARYGLEACTWVIAWDPRILANVHRIAPGLRLGFGHLPLTRFKGLCRVALGMIGDGRPVRALGKALALLGLEHNSQDVVVYVDRCSKPYPESRGGHGDFPIHVLSQLPGGDLGTMLRDTGGGVGAPVTLATPRYVEDAHSSGLAVFLFSVNSYRAARRVFERSRPDIIFANRAEAFSRQEAVHE